MGCHIQINPNFPKIYKTNSTLQFIIDIRLDIRSDKVSFRLRAKASEATDMSEIPDFGGKSAPVLGTPTSSFSAPSTDKDRMIAKLQEEVVRLRSQLDQFRQENHQLKQRVMELEGSSMISAQPSLASIEGASEDFTLTPLERPQFTNW
jgi:hypothetical protein